MYCARVIEEFESPFHMEVLSEYTHKIQNVNDGCGDEAHIYIMYQGDRIDNISFQAFGCASCLAVTSFLCRASLNKSVLQLAGMDRAFFRAAFSELEPSQTHCLDMAVVLIGKMISELEGGNRDLP